MMPMIVGCGHTRFDLDSCLQPSVKNPENAAPLKVTDRSPTTAGAATAVLVAGDTASNFRMHVLCARQLVGLAGEMQLSNVFLAPAVNVGGGAVATYASILEAVKA